MRKILRNFMQNAKAKAVYTSQARPGQDMPQKAAAAAAAGCIKWCTFSPGFSPPLPQLHPPQLPTEHNENVKHTFDQHMDSWHSVSSAPSPPLPTHSHRHSS